MNNNKKAGKYRKLSIELMFPSENSTLLILAFDELKFVANNWVFEIFLPLFILSFSKIIVFNIAPFPTAFFGSILDGIPSHMIKITIVAVVQWPLLMVL